MTLAWLAGVFLVVGVAVAALAWALYGPYGGDSRHRLVISIIAGAVWPVALAAAVVCMLALSVTYHNDPGDKRNGDGGDS